MTRRVAERKRPCLILADGRSLARQVARSAAHAGLRVLAGREVRGQPIRLVALHRRQTPATLFHLAAELPAGQSLLLLVGGARGALDLGAQAALPEPTGPALARALGLPNLETPAELAQAARLMALGLARVRQIGALAASDDEAALLADALQRAGLPVEVERSARRRPRARELVLVGPDVRIRPRRGVTLLTFSAAGETGPKMASPSTLSALAALQRVLPQPPAPAPTAGDRRAANRAAQALDGWPARLHQAQVAQLLACFGLHKATPAWGLARSASQASAIARRVGLPVTVAAVGAEPRLSAVRLGADSLSGCRQAFRDVLRACSRMQPQPDLEGMMVSAAVPPVSLECALLWPVDLPPLLLVGRPATEPQVHLCPLHPDTAAAAVAELLGPGAPGAKKLARLLVRLSRIGPGLVDRMRWICVDVVSPAQLVPGRAEQTEGLRAPPWL